MKKIRESGIDREGARYTITGTAKLCTLRCYDTCGTRFSISGSYDFVKQFV